MWKLGRLAVAFGLAGYGLTYSLLAAPAARAQECVEVHYTWGGVRNYIVPWQCYGPTGWPDECPWADPTIDGAGAGATVCVATPVAS